MSSSSAPPSTHPHPHTILFARGTIARLALWPALRLAVHQSWGGPESQEKQRWLAGVIVDQFEESIVYSSTSALSPTPTPTPNPTPTPPPTHAPTLQPPGEDDIEELLLQIMSDEFEVVLEDDSSAAVSKDIVKLFRSVCTGDDTLVKELEAQAERIKGKTPQYEVGAGSGSDWEDEDEDDGESGSEDGEGEGDVSQLLDRSGGGGREEPEVDEDGFTKVKKGRR
ncbi:hypothetical protein PAXINDRAFT_104199 [Paxillus involutus ATCC 200175]|uniref:Pre-rRNA-processing protein TSR2 n=1 Tax=Paxillus involutus ATCC 200175 TaxID=664439 RepID=A0A0C9SZ57_PAXIN|nr:hypothetical protein PAXINDRAFT_104199 [Paxillus involutus ATCC 200175]